MDLGRGVFARLPVPTQRWLADVALSTGLGRTYLDLALRSIEAFGGDRFLLDDLCRGVRRFDELGPAAAAQAEQLAARGERALAEGQRVTAKDLLRQATLFFAIADRLAEGPTKQANFLRLRAAADQMRALDPISTRRVVVGECPAYFRAPPAASATGGGVVIVQGTNTSKDMFFELEQALLARGLAVLNVDQPGTGESLMCGRRIRRLAELLPLARAVWEFLAANDERPVRRIGIFGFSLGGIVAPALCALEPRFAACAMVATGLCLDGATLDREPPQLKQRMMDLAGAPTWAEARAIALRGLDLRMLAPQVGCPVRAFHGERDRILPVAGARALFATLGSAERELTVVTGGDHTCSRSLRSDVLPTLFDWLAQTLT